MNPASVRTLLDYNYGEHRKVWQRCVMQLDEEQWQRDTGYSHGSIHAELVHLLHADWWWLQRARGCSPRERANMADYPDRAAIRARWDTIEAEIRAFAAGLDAAQLLAPAPYRTPAGERIDNRIWHILLHIVNHGTIHRAEIMAMAAMVGGPTFDLSLMRWLYGARY